MQNYHLDCSEYLVGTVTGLWSVQSRILFVAGTREFSLLQNNRTHSRIHPTSCSMGTRDSYPGTKATGSNVDCSPQSSVKVKNEWNYTCAPPLCLHGVRRENFTFTFLLLPDEKNKESCPFMYLPVFLFKHSS